MESVLKKFPDSRVSSHSAIPLCGLSDTLYRYSKTALLRRVVSSLSCPGHLVQFARLPGSCSRKRLLFFLQPPRTTCSLFFFFRAKSLRCSCRVRGSEQRTQEAARQSYKGRLDAGQFVLTRDVQRRIDLTSGRHYLFKSTESLFYFRFSFYIESIVSRRSHRLLYYNSCRRTYCVYMYYMCIVRIVL